MTNIEISFDEFCGQIKPLLFGFDKIKRETLIAQLHEANDLIKQADDASYKMFSELLGEEKAMDLENNINNEEKNSMVIQGLVDWVNAKYKNKSFVKDGVCLRKNIVNCAVRLKYDIELLGFISKLDDDNSRFVYVDFGDENGDVRIDVDEIIIAERTQ